MENIIKLSEFSSFSSNQAQSIDSEQFSLFMQRKPIWQFYSLTQDCYLQKTNQEKIRLIENYYKSMMEGKIFFRLEIYSFKTIQIALLESRLRTGCLCFFRKFVVSNDG